MVYPYFNVGTLFPRLNIKNITVSEEDSEQKTHTWKTECDIGFDDIQFSL